VWGKQKATGIPVFSVWTAATAGWFPTKQTICSVKDKIPTVSLTVGILFIKRVFDS
jgi:hypothetical protein